MALLPATLLSLAAGAGEGPQGDDSPYRQPTCGAVSLPISRDVGYVARIEPAAEAAMSMLVLETEVRAEELVFRFAGEPAGEPFLELARVDDHGGLSERAVACTVALRASEGLAAVAIAYKYSVGSRFATQTGAHWSICVVEGFGGAVAPAAQGPRVSSCHTTPADRTNAVAAIGYAPQKRWMQHAVDEDGPGYFSGTRLLLRDHDGDGYVDLLLWRRQEESAPAVTETEMTDDTAINRRVLEELLLLRFDPEARAFSDPSPIDLTLPPEAWWNARRPRP